MSEKVYIEIDAGAWLYASGIETAVYIGDGCEPCYINKETYEELIDKELEAHTVHGKLTNEYGHDNIGAAEDFVVGLENAATYARERFEELKSV